MCTLKWHLPHGVQHISLELIRLLIVACGIVSHSSSIAMQSCCFWWKLEHVVIHVDPEHPKHAQWVTCLVSMQTMEEQGHFQLPDEWHDNGPQDLDTISHSNFH